MWITTITSNRLLQQAGFMSNLFNRQGKIMEIKFTIKVVIIKAQNIKMI